MTTADVSPADVSSAPATAGPTSSAATSQDVEQPARVGAGRRYLLWWGAVCQLVSDLLLGSVYLVVIVTAAVGVGLVLAAGIGLLVLAVVAVVAFGLAYLERARLAAFTGVDVAPPPGPRDTTNVFRRLLLNSRPWKALLHLLLISLWGFVAGGTVLFGLSLGTAALLMPLYAGQLPEDRIALPLGNELSLDAVPWLALGGAGLLLLVVPVVSSLLVRVDVALVRGLLGAGEREQVARLSQRVETLTESRERAVDSVELERRRIERDLHDGPQQRLVAIAMDLGMARERLDRDPEGARTLLDDAHAAAKEAITEMRQVARGIHPPVLTDRGLDAALSALAARSPVPVDVHVSLAGRPSPTTEAIAYFCVSEALTNVAKHSRASGARVDVAAAEGSLLVYVSDNGRGGARFDGGSGLPGLRDRVAAVDGQLWVESPPGGPTRLTVRLPWTPARRPPVAPATTAPVTTAPATTTPVATAPAATTPVPDEQETTR